MGRECPSRIRLGNQIMLKGCTPCELTDDRYEYVKTTVTAEKPDLAVRGWYLNDQHLKLMGPAMSPLKERHWGP